MHERKSISVKYQSVKDQAKNQFLGSQHYYKPRGSMEELTPS